MHTDHGRSCGCCEPIQAAPLNRRSWLAGVASLGALSVLPRGALAAKGEYEAMVLACIDPRLQEPVHRYLAKRGLLGQYSQFVIAGAAIGVVAPKFADWHKAFWDNLAITIELHNIKSVMAIDHRDCGAAKVAYGDDCCSTPEKENATHKAVLSEFRKQVAQHQPRLKIETLLMALGGSVMTFS